jgi:hypothetical protein
MYLPVLRVDGCAKDSTSDARPDHCGNVEE